jgi:hypothetical protein
MKTAEEMLEANLSGFIAALNPHMDRIREVAPGVVGLLAETALGLFALDYALRKKGLLDSEEMTDALTEAQEAVRRLRARGDVFSAGSA